MATVVGAGHAQQFQQSQAENVFRRSGPAMGGSSGQTRQLSGCGVRGSDRRQTPHPPVDLRFYLPKRWIDDPGQRDKAGIPKDVRTLTSKCEHALAIVRQARAGATRFAWVGVGADYAKEPAVLRALDDAGETFVADVHRAQRVWSENPAPHISEAKFGRGPAPTKQHPRRHLSSWRP